MTDITHDAVTFFILLMMAVFLYLSLNTAGQLVLAGGLLLGVLITVFYHPLSDRNGETTADTSDSVAGQETALQPHQRSIADGDEE